MSKLNSKKHNIVYLTTNLITGHFYIGVHSTDVLDDGYIGTGSLIKAAKKKYGKKNFSREVLADFKCISEAYRWESIIVGKDLIEDPNCYNIAPGGSGCPISVNKGKKRSAETIERIKANHVGMTGQSHSYETRKRIKETQARNKEEQRMAIAMECRRMAISNRIK